MNVPSSNPNSVKDAKRAPAYPGCRHSGVASGFTLVELLVVMAIIILISGFIVTAISGGDGSQALNSGISKANGIFSVARSAAVQRKAPMRVLVHFDPEDPDKFLRYMVTLYLDDSETPPQWKVYSEGQYLPNGVYFSPGYSGQAGNLRLQTWRLTVGDDYQVNLIQPNPLFRNPYAMGNLNVDPLSHAIPGRDQWYTFEFNANGTSHQPGVRFVLANGILNLQNLELRIPNAEILGGFVIFRSGKAVHFQDTSQITGN
ncbi:MAG: prepilin-type N-terminal cleavage/methylation domain-containing protein [Verrucomicrobia bacterium]|nr:prepilin-type N-terminal cleavage/methylation domain-containing protein [Verrucomicrobiota bacterium]MCH8510911.1 prepilin-type N-terminal cleavage/methylation domain-containing protein [Kiritimatiellia bacterium]